MQFVNFLFNIYIFVYFFSQNALQNRTRFRDCFAADFPSYRRFYRQFEPSKDSARLRYGASPPAEHRLDDLSLDEDVGGRSYGGYDIVQSRHNHVARSSYTRNESRGVLMGGGFDAPTTNTTGQIIVEPHLYGPQTVSRMLQSSGEQLNNGDLSGRRAVSDAQNIEMTPFVGGHRDDFEPYSLYHSDLSSKAQDLQRVSQYIQSLPDLPIYHHHEATSELAQPRSATVRDHSMLFANAVQGSGHGQGKTSDTSASSPVPPPPPAPPDPPQESAKKSPTTGERIFSALSALTSRSYIDASEFYK